MKTAKQILIDKCYENKDCFLSGQMRWILEAMEEYAAQEREEKPLPRTFTIENMRECFEQSRLTHPMVGFKYDTFEQFISLSNQNDF